MLKSRFTVTVILFISLLPNVGLADSPLPPTAAEVPNGKVIMLWTQLIGYNNNESETQPLKGVARFFVQGYSSSENSYCRNFGFVVGPNPEYIDSSISHRANPNSSAFPITVCEIELGPQWSNIVLVPLIAFLNYDGDEEYIRYFNENGDLTFKVANIPSLYDVGKKYNGDKIRMVTTADTGCRDKPGDPSNKNYQDCIPAQWPFKSVVENMASNKPYLTIHAGDYRYRQSLSSHDDNWSDWYQDFFYPASRLLFSAYPTGSSVWAFIRGNHERCGDQGGEGWYYLLDSHTVGDEVACDATNPHDLSLDSTNLAHHWYADISAGSVPQSDMLYPHRLIFLDTSSKSAPSGVDHDDFDDAFEEAFEDMDDWANDAVDTAWWAMHRPIWGITTDTSKSAGIKTRTSELQDFIEESIGGGDKGNAHPDCNADLDDGNGYLGGVWSYDKVTCHLRSILSGHSHLLSISRFYEDEGDTGGIWMRPQQVITGHGGVNLDPQLPPKTTPCNIEIDGLDSTIKWGDYYWGYLLWDRTGDIDETGHQSGWDMSQKVVSGSKQQSTNNVPACAN